MIHISPTRITKFLIGVVIGLALASLLGQYFKFYLGDDMMFGFVPRFDVNTEQSIPTWYSSITLLLCSSLLATIAIAKHTAGDRFRYYWTGLAIAFLYLSVDEAASLHELLNYATPKVLPNSQSFSQPWVIPAALFALVFGIAYVRFLLHLPKKTQRFFVAAFVLYVGGAVLMEVVGALHWQSASSTGELSADQNMIMAVMLTIEEVFEMLGVLAFIYGLLDYIATQFQRLTVSVGSSTAPASARPAPAMSQMIRHSFEDTIDSQDI
ncbi:MAG TPA: hypothetical protein V6D20_09820 [Candidatus Obscuribacterales bacterium]